MPIVFASLQHVTLPINVKIPVTLLQILYIYMTVLSSNFDFKNHRFAILVLAELLIILNFERKVYEYMRPILYVLESLVLH